MNKTPIIASSAIVKRGGEILLIKRKYPPGIGKWALPGGHVEYGETVEQAALREVKEETKIDMKIERLLNVYSLILRDENGEIKRHYAIMCFESTYKNSPLQPNCEVEDAGWFKPETLTNLPLVSTTRLAFKDAGYLK